LIGDLLPGAGSWSLHESETRVNPICRDFLRQDDFLTVRRGRDTIECDEGGRFDGSLAARECEARRRNGQAFGSVARQGFFGRIASAERLSASVVA
jgi:hypothetical protein